MKKFNTLYLGPSKRPEVKSSAGVWRRLIENEPSRSGYRSQQTFRLAPEGTIFVRRDGIYRKVNNELIKIGELRNDK